ncbi:hypothetical protein K402DRAFT_325370 [Aulographum hederae CBS 113979]|uniref:Uncharacterized protein n=1 Tax=Aulographum hederae CBS 113979 TaxID=1176131 RepID=A0A6G1HAG6_9PEZI|nr:hypothetical protein K402DRAFT_325370 [Aulographum hederae CBS 113979]
MEDGDTQTEYSGIAAEFARAKAVREKEEAQGLRASGRDAKASSKRKEVEFAAAHGLLVAFFMWICLLHVSGIYLFTSGFLLTKLVLDHKSSCDVPPVEIAGRYIGGTVEEGCWHPKTFDKAVVIIVDALRYDFTVPFRQTIPDENPHHFHNAIPVFYETATQQPNHAFLLPFIADPPTTTLQRLKGLTTGTLPTFIDAGSNFAGTAIDEDNLVAQLVNASKRVVHLGDDTWHALFPGYFEPNLTKAYDSFNVWDLHTVDNGVSEHLFPLLGSENQKKWDIIFGHYLGVDHAGHRYGPEHPAMTAKLRQMDGVFRRMIESIDDRTLLVVMGDHGMDSKGDHGGESDDEIQAALWMYSKKPIFGRSDPAFTEPPATAKERPVAQIDLVPTLALLLGLPIPFNNLGGPIEEAFVGTQGNNYENLARVNRLAASQVHRYMSEYAQVRNLDPTATASTAGLWTIANGMWRTTQQSPHTPPIMFRSPAASFNNYQKRTLAVCRDLWARFDRLAMLNGILVLAGALVVLVVYARGITGDRTDLTPILLVRSVSGTIAGGAAGAFAALSISEIPFTHATVFCSAVGGLFGVSSAFWLARRRLCSPLPNSLWSWVGVVFTVLLSIGFASNSFTIWEDEILLFFLSTFSMLMFASSLRLATPLDRTLGCYHSASFLVLSRLASLSRLCREEQMPYCRSTYYASANSSTSAAWQLIIPYLLTIFLPGVIATYYKGTRSYQNSIVPWLGLAFRVGLLISALFWTLDAADDADWLPWLPSTALKTIKVLLAQIVLAIAFAAGYSTYAWSAPFLSIQTRPAGAPADPADAGAHVVSAGGSSSIVVHGYANVHGSRYFLLPTLWALGCILLSKPMGGGALAILVWQILCLCEIVAVNHLQSSSVGPLVLALLGSFHFFKTGHQATLSSIQWEAAFIPLKTIRYPWSPLLVLLNTFAAQILCAIAVPAIVLWKQPPKRKALLGEVAKAMATHTLFYAVVGLATTVWAGWLRRHLMLYRIFSPRFMMGAVVLVVVEVVGVLVGVGGVRWSFLSVAEVFGW